MLKARSIGVMGGGQLGRMLAHAAQRLGMTVTVLDPQADCPAGQAADAHLQAAYDDHRALDELASRCDAITTEFENVPAPSLIRLAQHKPVRPSAAAVAIAQDRLLEKQYFREQGIDTALFWSLEGVGELDRDASIDACREANFPAILKTRRLGYDGKGQLDVPDFGSLPGAWAALGHEDCLLEERLDLRVELSVVLARSRDAELSVYPAIENIHTRGILDRSYFPARCDARLASRAAELAARLAAPRPHNSGHVTMDACAISQFEQQARVLAGFPLGSSEHHAYACLINLLGERWFDRAGNYCEPDWARLLAIEGLHLHLYGKREPRLGRKMGHINLCASSEALVDQTLVQVIGILERSS
ncbi:MAG: 5-(carboxyamino)imidazole ribonucleotide synthase [Betaproteobacteria bacterium]|nr:5-(carboxyamino)imidazole ribonucleotide synthase [Betaproteobacteria bacterium]